MVRVISIPLMLFAITEACAQTPQGLPASDLGGSLLQLLLGLALVLAILIGGLWLLKKILERRGESSGLLRVVAASAVGTRERVVIVEVGSTWLVLGVAPGHVSALAEIPRQTAAEPPATPESLSANGFPGWLGKLAPRK